MSNKNNRGAHIIIELNTGTVDGYYFDLDEALDMLHNWYAVEYPWGNWLVAKTVDGNTEGSAIPTHVFNATRLRNVPMGVKNLDEAVAHITD